MKSTVLVFAILAIIFERFSALEVPKVFHKCSLKDPNLSECLTKSANEAWPMFVKEKEMLTKYRVAIEPLEANLIITGQNAPLKTNMTDVKLYGVKDFTFRKIDLNMETKKLVIDFTCPEVKFLCNYKIGGRMLLLPIEGAGPGSLIFTNRDDSLELDFDIIEKKGKKYINISNSKFTSLHGRITYKLDNLFGGNKLLGDNMNKVMNENWEDVEKQNGEELTQAIGAMYASIPRGFLSKVPLNDLFDA